MAIVDPEITEGFQCFQENCLTPLSGWVRGVYARGEVLGHDQLLAGFAQILREPLQVQPIIPFPAFALEAVVEVEAVNIGNQPFHLLHPVAFHFFLDFCKKLVIPNVSNPPGDSISRPTLPKGSVSFSGFTLFFNDFNP